MRTYSFYIVCGGQVRGRCPVTDEAVDAVAGARALWRDTRKCGALSRPGRGRSCGHLDFPALAIRAAVQLPDPTPMAPPRLARRPLVKPLGFSKSTTRHAVHFRKSMFRGRTTRSEQVFYMLTERSMRISVALLFSFLGAT